MSSDEDGFSGAEWVSDHADAYPALPYPGARRTGSWCLCSTGQLHRLVSSGNGSWRDLESDQLVERDGRTLVLAYGSNANPQKLRALTDPDVYAFAATVRDWGAVWCSRRRAAGDVVCTLVPMPGARESHMVLALTADQLRKVDGWETHPDFYRREDFPGHLTLEDGSSPAVQVYLGTPAHRPALIVGGRLLRCADVSYSEVDLLVAR